MSAPAGVPSDPRRTRLRAAIVAAVALATYAGAVPSGFVFDDRDAVQGNAVVQGEVPLGEAFARDWWGNLAPNIVPSYRPLPVLWFRADWVLGGGRPWPFHAWNVLLHALVAVASYLVWRRLAPERVAFAGALVAAVLAARSEGVDAIVGRADLVQALALTIALAAHRRPGARGAAIAAIALLAAMFSKETTIVAPIVFLLLDFMLPVPAAPLRARLGRFALYAGAIALYLAGRYHAFGTLAFRRTETLYNPLLEADLVHRVFGAGRIFAERYLLGVLDPGRRLYDCSGSACMPAGADDPVAWAGLVLFAAFCLAPLLLWKRAPVAAAGLLWFIAFFGPVSNVPIVATLTYGERLLYVPLIGLCVTIAAAVDAVASRVSRPVLAWGALAVVGLANAAAVQWRHLDWRTPASLAASGLAYAGDSVVVLGNNATAAIDRGDPVAAEDFARRAIEAWPSDPYAHKLLGLALHLQGRDDEAEVEFRQALVSERPHSDIAADVAAFLARRGRFHEALHLVRRQLRIDPDDARLRDLERRLMQKVRSIEQ